MPTIWKTLFDSATLQLRTYYPVRNNLPEIIVTNVNLLEVSVNPRHRILDEKQLV